eukprot:305033_1
MDTVTYGTLGGIHNLGHSDLVFNYKMAFEAMAENEFRTQEHELFTSPLIEELKRQHPTQSLQVSDFQSISLKALHAMLKHKWLFQSYTYCELYQSLVNSIKYNRSRNTCKSKNKARKPLAVILKIIDILINERHLNLFPFHQTPYSDSICKDIAEKNVILLSSIAFTKSQDRLDSKRNFLRFFNMQSANLTNTNNSDLDVMSVLLSCCYSADERYYLLRTIWERETQNIKGIQSALKGSDLHPHLAQIVSKYC